MRESGNGLEWRAQQYARGAMDPDEAAVFERCLGEDQAAREALAQAVARTQLPLPDPRYRSEVRRRLTPDAPRGWPRHPAGWVVCGAAAALLVVLPLWLYSPPFAGPAEPVASVETIVIAPPVVPTPPETDTALVWAEITKHERLLRACDDELQRKSRREERRFSRSLDDSADRYVTEPTMKNH